MIPYQILRHTRAHRPIALVYHSVTPGAGAPAWKWSVSAARYVEQLELLQECGFRTVGIQSLASLGASLPPKTVAITFDDGYSDNLSACQALLDRQMTGTVFVVSGAVGTRATWQPPAESCPMLTGPQLTELHSSGIEIGSHTVSHSDLTSLGRQHAERELIDSKCQLEDIIQSPVLSFAFPFGRYSEPLIAATREAGYAAACSTDSGWAIRDACAFKIRRISVYAGDTLNTFAKKLLFADNSVEGSRLPKYLLQHATRAARHVFRHER